ncbi:MAG: polysaccharide deacetylase family protein [Thermoleophilia bacterium]|nr:polysaccharide deacetylase family protein [Thermoleophilia bacterium]
MRAEPPAKYVVIAGDTLSRIAVKFGMTVQVLAAANHIADPNLIRVGQRLTIPGATGATPPVSLPAPAPPPPPSAVAYTVVAGDTLSKIAARHGTTVDAIAQLNGITDPNLISVGQRLAVTAGTASPVSPSTGGTMGKVALTFDDGPNGGATDAILATLAKHQVHATFFVIGSQVANGATRIRQERDAGHAIGNHSWSHRDLTTLSAADVRSELARTSDAIQTVTGARPTMFRSPYGARNASVDAIGRQLGMQQTLWGVDTVDWSRPGVDNIVSRAVNGARAGSVILMHDGGGNRQQTAAALDRVIVGLQARGFELVTVPELDAAR